MANPAGFLDYSRKGAPKRPVTERVRDYREVTLPIPLETVTEQATRCMSCAVPFCHHGCPLHNLIPEWNDLVSRDDWRRAYERLDLTNNFPEFTGRLCPAPCETSCVLAIADEPVTIKDIEESIIERAFADGHVRPRPPAHRTGRRVAVVGSGPAGLAAAQQLNRHGHWVTVFERADRLGGLLRYGIPDFKIDKSVVDRRLDLLSAEGITFESGYDVGRDVTAAGLRERYDAVVLAVGAERHRDIDVVGRNLPGVHFAMDYLTVQNRRVAGDNIAPDAISTAGKRVVIIGAGDTAADCLGNAHREGCSSVTEFSIYPEPPRQRGSGDHWPDWPLILRTYPAHEEGGSRDWNVAVTGFGGKDQLEWLDAVRVNVSGTGAQRSVQPVTGSEFRVECDLVLLAIGFDGVRPLTLLGDLALTTSPAGTIPAVNGATSEAGIFAAGDAVVGASLVVTAIADGRRAAESCHAFLRG